MSMFPAARICDCGSGQYSEWEYDARGIELCRCCDACRKERLAGYRSEVLNDSDYECDEDVEPDYEGSQFDGLDGDYLD